MLVVRCDTLSSKSTEITHPNYENAVSSSVFTLMTLTGIVMKKASLVYSLFQTISSSFCNFTKGDNIGKSDIPNKYSGIINDIKNNNISVNIHIGYYIHAFKLSVYYLNNFPEMGENQDKELYYTIMCDICDRGGDTDTNCAIVGTFYFSRLCLYIWKIIGRIKKIGNNQIIKPHIINDIYSYSYYVKNEIKDLKYYY